MTLTLATSNLLAEGPYRKTRLGTIQGPQVPLESRTAAFRKYFENTNTEIHFFQELDENWQKILIESAACKGDKLIVRTCRKLKLAIAYNAVRFIDMQLLMHHREAGILAISLYDTVLRNRLKLVNVHADWGRAGNFISSFEEAFQGNDDSTIVGGDFNLDSNNKVFFDDFFMKYGYIELSSNVSFTAKYVRDASQPVKLDLLISKNIQSYSSVSIYPEDFNKLLPHTIDPMFNPKDPNNHYSDHVILTCSISYAP